MGRQFLRTDVPRALFAMSCLILAFAYGVAVGRYEIFPYAALEFGKDAVGQTMQEARIFVTRRPTAFLRPARYEGRGVTRAERDRMAPGFTLLTGFFESGHEARLLRWDGSVVRRWSIRFYDVFPDPRHIEPKDMVPRTNWNIDPHGALLLPDGSLVFNFEYGGLVKMARCGAVQWRVARMTHHSVDMSADGGFWVPSRRAILDNSPFSELQPPYYEETLLEVSSDGEVLREISLLSLLFEGGLRPIFFSNVGMEAIRLPAGPNRIPADLTHLNDIEELTADMAVHFPQFDRGDLLLSLRDLNLVMVVDPRRRRVRWTQTGPWIAQHDPDFVADGTITVFNNNNDGTSSGTIWGGSNIMAVDPVTGEVSVTYGATSGTAFFSSVRGKHQALANGNTLITDAEDGRVFEVDSAGTIVWEFVNRFDDDEIALVYDALRYPEEYFAVSDWHCPAEGSVDEEGTE